MSNNITPIPTTRASEPLTRTRLLAQLQADQLGMFRLQTQLSTGRRIFVPSEDAPAALRAISLQRLIERKEQIKVNLATNQSYLAASDAALSTSSSLIADIRGQALSVSGTSTPEQRQAVISSIQRALGQLVDIGNRNFRGRYLFSGTRVAEAPFRANGNFIEYLGNEGSLRSFSDIDTLFDSGLNGNEVFGAVSDPIRGTTDLNRTVDEGTLLADLRGGQGISKGSIRISDGARTSIVDLSSAVTLGDVARLIEANPPQSTNPPVTRVLTVSIKPQGLVIEMDSAGGGNLTIHEVGGGTTAGELGILETDGVGINPLVGGDLNPTLQLTTRIDDILGSRANGRVMSSGDNNDFTIAANAIGDQFNDVRVQMVDDELLRAGAGLATGSEVAEYSATARAASASLALAGANNDLIFTATTAGAAYNNVRIVIEDAGNIGNTATANYTDVGGVRTLTIGIDDTDQTTLATMIAAVESSTPFTVSADSSAGEGFNGATAVQTVNAGAISGNTGNSGGDARTLFVRIKNGSSTTENVVAAINAEGTFTAQIDPRDAPLVKQAGKGLIDLAATGVTSGGGGVALDQESGLRVTNGGRTFDIDISDAVTIEDLLNAINGAGAGVVAEINSQGTGINVRSRLSGADFSIGENGGITATQLGLRSLTENTRLEELNYGLGVKRELTGNVPADPHTFVIRRNDGVELTIDVANDETVGDVLDRINNHPGNTGAAKVVARLAQFGNGIELVDDDPTGLDSQGNPNTIQVRTTETSQAAVYLGLVPPGESQSAPPTAGAIATGATAFAGANSNLVFSARTSGTALNGAKIEFVNSSAVGNQALVSYSSVTNTLTIDVDPANTTAATVASAVTNEVGGLFTATLDTSAGANDGSGLMTVTGEVAELTGGTAEVLTGGDPNPIETGGIFNTLLRLQTALETNDEVEIQRTIAAIDGDLERFSFARAEIGARQQGLDVLQDRIQSEDVELRSSLSTEIDVDITEAISNLTARQLSYEASLRASGALLQLTLLSFLD